MNVQWVINYFICHGNQFEYCVNKTNRLSIKLDSFYIKANSRAQIKWFSLWCPSFSSNGYYSPCCEALFTFILSVSFTTIKMYSINDPSFTFKGLLPRCKVFPKTCLPLNLFRSPTLNHSRTLWLKCKVPFLFIIINESTSLDLFRQNIVQFWMLSFPLAR
jgi:hypothetical protein